jgi:hypothetical protein
MSAVMTAEVAYSQVKEVAATVADDTAKTVNYTGPGCRVRQGDIFLYFFESDKLPGNLPVLEPTNIELQLAPGNTQGSRHVLDSPSGIEMFKVRGADALTGPVFKTTEQRTVTHPEHGDVVIPAGLTVFVRYERAFAAELRAVRD